MKHQTLKIFVHICNDKVKKHKICAFHPIKQQFVHYIHIDMEENCCLIGLLCVRVCVCVREWERGVCVCVCVCAQID